MSLFVDTSVFYASVDADDIDHERARSILARDERLVTSDHILVETWRLLRVRTGRDVAEQFWTTIRAGAAAVEFVEAQDLELAWAIGQQFPDQDFSIVDRTSFALMQRIGVHRVTSFDSDYAIYRFGPRGDRAFEIVA